MEQKILFILSLCILMSFPSIVSAQTYRKDTVVDLKIPFEVNGTAASELATCNVSIQYPNSSYVRNNVNATNNNNGEFNITLTGGDTDAVGTYDWTAFCCDTNTRCAAGYGEIEITPSGDNEMSSGEGIATFGSLLVMILVTMMFFLISIRLQSPFGKFALLVVSLVFLVITILYSMVIVDQALGGFANIIHGYSTFIFIIKVLVRAGGLALAVFGILVALRLYKYKRGLID
jgi:hypothetical protein